MTARSSTPRSRIVLAGVLLLLWVSAACSREAPAARRPNVLWIIADQHRADVAGFAGDANAFTPNLDTLASQSAWVTDVYCQSPSCAPARASLLTGRYPHDHGCFRNRQSNPIEQKTVIRALNGAGYRTALIGKGHCPKADFQYVRDVHDQLEDFLEQHPGGTRPGLKWFGRRKDAKRKYVGPMNPDLVAADAGAEGSDVFYMEEHVTKDALSFLDDAGDEPFFLWASYLNPHPPLFPPEEFVARFRDADLPTFGRLDVNEPGLFPDLSSRRRAHRLGEISSEQLLNITRAYYASLAWTDHCIGELLRGLEERGLAENTLVIYTSDHGELLGQHGLLQKRALFEGALRVPLLLRWPDKLPVAIHKRVASHIDLTATLFDLIGVGAPAEIAGRSMRGFLEGDPEAVWEDTAMVESVLGETTGVPVERSADRMAPPSGFGWMLREGRWKYVQHVPGWNALYDLEQDPEELTNLLKVENVAPEHRQRAQAMVETLANATPMTWRYLDKDDLLINRYMSSED